MRTIIRVNDMNKDKLDELVAKLLPLSKPMEEIKEKDDEQTDR